MTEAHDPCDPAARWCLVEIARMTSWSSGGAKYSTGASISVSAEIALRLFGARSIGLAYFNAQAEGFEVWVDVRKQGPEAADLFNFETAGIRARLCLAPAELNGDQGELYRALRDPQTTMPSIADATMAAKMALVSP